MSEIKLECVFRTCAEDITDTLSNQVLRTLDITTRDDLQIVCPRHHCGHNQVSTSSDHIYEWKLDGRSSLRLSSKNSFRPLKGDGKENHLSVDVVPFEDPGSLTNVKRCIAKIRSRRRTDTQGAVTEPLFAAMMKQLEFAPTTKECGLRRFEECGWLLVDATYKPVNALSGAGRQAVILGDYPHLRQDLLTRISAPAASEASGENQNEEDDDQDAKHADAAMTEAVTIAREATAEATEEEYDENDEKNGTKRYAVSSTGRALPTY